MAHKLNIERVERGECGSHYCDGHTDTYLVCEEGDLRVNFYSRGENAKKMVELEHRLDVMEREK